MPLTLLDCALIALIILAVVSGARSGVVASVLSVVGVVAGAVSGIILAPRLINGITNDVGRVLAGVLVIVGLVVVGEMFGIAAGNVARTVMSGGRVRRVVDSVFGALAQGLAVCVVLWLIAYPLSASPTAIGTAVNRSLVLADLDQVINRVAPKPIRALPDSVAALMDSSGLPQVMAPFDRTAIAPAEPPDPALVGAPAVQAAAASVVQVRGTAFSCRRSLEGTGFVYAPGKVMTNAHVVAGTDALEVSVGALTLPASVVVFDPMIDIAVLDVPYLTAPHLEWAQDPGARGAPAVVLGYPGGGPYKGTAARVRELLELTGPDMYRTGKLVSREVYSIRAVVQQGNSGGPLVNADGEVLGVVFGAATDDPDTGFALTATEVRSLADKGTDAVAPVKTDACVG
jgi:S1-C subfamily serine protease